MENNFLNYINPLQFMDLNKLNVFPYLYLDIKIYIGAHYLKMEIIELE